MSAANRNQVQHTEISKKTNSSLLTFLRLLT